MNLEEKKISGRRAYDGSFLHVNHDEIELPNGKTASREYIIHPGAAVIAPLNDAGELLFVKQYRYPFHTVTLELPAGKLDAGEEPAVCAARELREETGATAEKITPLGRLFVSPAYSDETIYMYLATGLSFGEADPDDDEFVECEKIPLDTAVKMVMNDEIPDSKTQLLILKLYNLKSEGSL